MPSKSSPPCCVFSSLFFLFLKDNLYFFRMLVDNTSFDLPMETWTSGIEKPMTSLKTPSKPSQKIRSRQKPIDKNQPKRKKCPQKEKERNLALNKGYELLQSKIKYINENSKIPKVKILRTAISYIEYLQKKLNTVSLLFLHPKWQMSAFWI